MPKGLRLAFAGHYVLIPERPGYGASDLAPHQVLVRDWVDDAQALLAVLGIKRVRVVGYSGGGAFALACANRLGECVSDVVLFSAIAPLQDHDVKAGLSPMIAALYDAAADDADALLAQWTREAPAPGQLVDTFLADTASADRLVAQDAGVHRALVTDFERAFKCGFAGWVGDMRKLAHPWGFDLGDVDVPVVLWHGQEDRNTPIAMGRYLARSLPKAILHEVPGHGHLLSFSGDSEVLGVNIAETTTRVNARLA